jgi:1-phosphofructokinase
VPTRTNITVAEPGRTTKVNAPGHALVAADYEALTGVVAERARSARWVVISGSVPPYAPDDLVPGLVTAARDAGARVAVDISGTALRTAMSAGPDVLAPNLDELAELVGRPLADDEALDAAMSVSRNTGSALLVSLGEAGALWIDCTKLPDRMWHAVAPPVIPVNTVGAGDALLAGWLAGEHDDGQDAAPAQLARAVAWGTAACLMPGTTGNVAARAAIAAVTVTDLTTTGAFRHTSNT